MNLLKIFLILSLNFGIIILFGGCEKLEQKNLFSEENNSVLNGDFLKGDGLKENDLNELGSDDFFDGAEFDTAGGSDLGASILNGVSMDGNYFNVTTGLDLHEMTGYIDFEDGTFEKNGEIYSLNPSSGDKIDGLKIAFANSSTNGVFDSVSYSGYGMESLSSINGKTEFKIYFDGDDETSRGKILKNIFTKDENFLTQVKFAQSKIDGKKYVPVKIHTKVVGQLMENEDGGRLFTWPCLSSDFTSDENNFKNSEEIFSPFFYEKTNKGFFLDSLGAWSVSSADNIDINGSCAYNDTYFTNKSNVVGSECWSGVNRKDVGRVVFRVKKDSFCSQDISIKNELYYPRYACNINIEKIGSNTDSQLYLGGDSFPLEGEKYNCGE